jgi:hypothetical protein
LSGNTRDPVVFWTLGQGAGHKEPVIDGQATAEILRGLQEVPDPRRANGRYSAIKTVRYYEEPDQSNVFHFLGFAYEPYGPPFRSLSFVWVRIPLWFPTLVSGGLLWLVWRKTRPRYKPGTGFPVEPASARPSTSL